MSTEINWGYNCLTVGIHHGRPEAVWNLPLFQAVMMFGTDGLKQLVVARIHSDALQFVAHPNADSSITTEPWAHRVHILAEEKFDGLLSAKMLELTNYYDSPGWRSDIKNMIEWYKDGKLSPHYKPLHSHDSINMLCRILGTSCSRDATAKVADFPNLLKRLVSED